MATSQEYTMNRVKIHFPHKAYPSQVAMMNQIVRSLQQSKNALLESPTGSGKSLALLCAALAWQRDEKERAREYNDAVEKGIIEAEYEDVPDDEAAEGNDDVTVGEAVRAAMEEAQRTGAGGGFIPAEMPPDDDDDDDFVSGMGRLARPKMPTKSNNVPPPLQTVPIPSHAQPAPQMRKVKKKTVPKIYFGTRTHKQIAQIIRELNKTVYKGARMTILASREHTCIHPTVSKSKNKTEGCKEMMDRNKGGGCTYQSNVKSKLATHHAVNAYRGGTKDAWDLEDLVKVGKKVRACPYFATRELRPKSDIIFCPYNYLIEPLIRKSMEITLRGQIVILDEAHNIEDSARDAASWNVTQEHVREAIQDLEAVAANGSQNPDAHRKVADTLSHLSQWIDGSKDQLNDYTSFDSSSKIWTGQEIAGVFKVYGIDERTLANDLKPAVEAVVAEWRENVEAEREERSANFDPDVQKIPTLHSNTVSLIDGFLMVLDYLYVDGLRHLGDYRVALTKAQVKKKFKPSKPISGWYNSKNSSDAGGVHASYTFTANFWCLNPAVSFETFKEETRSIVLTSGTLSPMASFSSELDVPFALRLEANHVIDKRQVWIRTLSHGPAGQSLNATYKNAESYAFQDELGRVVAQVCETVPHGVLLFLPSYAMLNKLSERWKQNGSKIWQRMSAKKVVVAEPRFSDEFESCIRHYYDVIRATDEAPNGDGVDGALFMAVCRGKVSEGLDFADNHARAVICVGIPFPNVKDIQVDLKRKYNDVRKREENRELLSGKEWYDIQAFRALNQALGRCIRHRRDWGAILMVDDRYQKNPNYLQSLSKWVRSGVSHYSNCRLMFEDLKSFNAEMVACDEEYKREMAERETTTESATATDAGIMLEDIKTDAAKAMQEHQQKKKRQRGSADSADKGKRAKRDEHPLAENSISKISVEDHKLNGFMEAKYAPGKTRAYDMEAISLS